ncbi:MAG: phosphoglycerate kinase [Patescibacteria group bacterium]
MKINSLSKIKSLSGRTVFLRVDFNVPLQDGKIIEDHKIKAVLETIEFLVVHRARLIIATHLGKPKGREEGYSVRPVAARLKKLLKKPVRFFSDPLSPRTAAALKKMRDGEIALLENLRFYQGEYNNDSAFARSLAALADVYVNDAFAVSHRAQASVAAIKKYLPSYAGLLLEKEIIALSRILKPKKPLVVVMGGAKIETKAPLLAKLYPLADKILLGGALANNFFKFQKLEVGRSLIDKGKISEMAVKKFFPRSVLASKIVLPGDVIVKDSKGRARLKKISALLRTDQIFDIGPETISAYAGYLKKARTLVWNGPMGKFEESSFSHGTLAIARLVAARSSGRAYGVIGGGETVAALEKTGMAEYVDWISTAGGAMLTYLGGGKMPGLDKIVK